MTHTSQREYAKPLTILCRSCGHAHFFNQPYAYHAGFSDQGFLYNDEGNLTFVWRAYDPTYSEIVGDSNPWALNESQKQRLEAWLPPAPRGGRWRFENPARCLKCKKAISAPIGSSIYYLIYDGSVVVDGQPGNPVAWLKDLKNSTR